MRGVLVVLATLLSVACKEAGTRSQVVVLVDADQEVREATDRLRIEVEGREARHDDDGVSRLMEPPFKPDWPVRIALAPRDGDDSRLYMVTAEALDAEGTTVTVARLLSGFVPGEVRYVRLLLEHSCVGEMCGEEDTCTMATCTDPFLEATSFSRDADEPADTASLLQSRDASMDAGMRPGSDAAVGGDAGAQSPAAGAQLSSGDAHSCLIDGDGALWCWGENEGGQLGLGEAGDPVPVPTRVGDANDWVSLSAGAVHTCALRADGSLWCWGDDDVGWLGTGGTSWALEPVRIDSDQPWRSVSAGLQNTCGIKADGSLWCWGAAEDGALGIGPASENEPLPVRVGEDRDWWQVAVGFYHACALRDDGTRWCWGRNDLGQLGDGTTEGRDAPARADDDTGWVSIDSGDSFGCGVRGDALYCWGDGVSGRLGDGTEDASTTPVAVTLGEGVSWTQLDTGSSHSCALRADGSLRCWGYNGNGSVGDGTFRDVRTPFRIEPDEWAAVGAGWKHTCALRTDGELWCWGDNDMGQLALGRVGRQTTPQQVGADDDWTALGVGDGHVCGVRNGGALFCWGEGEYGQLGDGKAEFNPSVTRVGTDGDWSEVTAGTFHTCATRTDGTLWCWGSNWPGTVGDGSTTDRHEPTRTSSDADWHSPSAGYWHSCALKTDGTLWCWGRDVGEAPKRIGSDSDWTSVHVAGKWLARYAGLRADRGIWEASADSLTQLGSVTDWQSFDYGAGHACGIRGSGALYCWGENREGQLGDGTREERTGEVMASSDSDWTVVDVGRRHSCGIRGGGMLFCWGSGHHGQLGVGRADDTGTPTRVGSDDDWTLVDAAYHNTCGLRAPGSLWCWGSNTSGQLGNGMGGRPSPVQATQP